MLKKIIIAFSLLSLLFAIYELSYNENFTPIILVLCAILIQIFGSVIGGSMFLSIPLVQLLFPSVSFGMIIGNIKAGSVARSISTTLTTKEHIKFKENFIFIFPAIIGSILGVSLIAQLDQKWILPAVIFAIILSESSHFLNKFIGKKTFFITSVFVGLYAGFLGAGIGVILLAMMRLKYPEDKDIGLIKIQARFVEFLLAIVALSTHIMHNNVIFDIWFYWVGGSLLGGIIGGNLLKQIIHLKGNQQKMILRIAFAFAILIAYKKFIV